MVFRNDLLAPAYRLRPAGRADEDAVAPDDRAGMALADQRRFPGHVLGVLTSPTDRQGLLTGKAHAGGPAKLRPVVRSGHGATDHENGKNAAAEMAKAFELVNNYMFEDCRDRRGPEYGNQGQMTIRWARQNVDTWLKDLNPEVALIMFGTNDLGGLEVQEYEIRMRAGPEPILWGIDRLEAAVPEFGGFSGPSLLHGRPKRRSNGQTLGVTDPRDSSLRVRHFPA